MKKIRYIGFYLAINWGLVSSQHAFAGFQGIGGTIERESEISLEAFDDLIERFDRLLAYRIDSAPGFIREAFYVYEHGGLKKGSKIKLKKRFQKLLTSSWNGNNGLGDWLDWQNLELQFPENED